MITSDVKDFILDIISDVVQAICVYLLSSVCYVICAITSFTLGLTLIIYAPIIIPCLWIVSIFYTLEHKLSN